MSWHRSGDAKEVCLMSTPFGKVLLVLLVVGSLYVGFQFVPLQEILNPETLSSTLQELGILGPMALMGLMTLAVVLSPIPSLPIDLAAGAAYGPFWGGVYVLFGAELGAVISFLIGRALGREFLTRWLRRDITFCEQCSDHHMMGVLVLARLIPLFSFDIVSYGAGLTTVSLRAFALATFLGMIPPTFALTYLGSAVVTVEWPLVIAGGMLVVVFLLLPRWIVQNRSSRWVRVLQGKPMIPVVVSNSSSQTKKEKGCGWCGKEM